MRTSSRFPAMGAGVRDWYGKFSGTLLLVAGAAILMGIITAEALYPAAYSTHRNTVSHLAAMDDIIVRQPSAAIINWTMIIAGLVVIVAAYYLYRALQRKAIPIATALLGIGMVGVGIFPANHGNTHTLFAMLAFAAGSIAAILSWKVLTGPLRYICLLLGTAALVSMILSTDLFIDWAPVARLGEGGIERWIVYPVVLWMVTFGAWLASRPAAVQAKGAPPQQETTPALPEPAGYHATSR